MKKVILTTEHFLFTYGETPAIAIAKYVEDIEPELGNEWGFVEKYLPNYTQDAAVAKSNDYAVILETKGDCYGDSDSGAKWELENTCGGDWTKAEALLDDVDAAIYQRAVEGFIANK